jgi:D-beta-D-heptose 7-phosphate kinase/D-beta-D-heptose 1-phosphate adenosyltransferase
MMDYQRAQQIIGKFPDLRIVTVGDLMLDEFIWGEARRISPEAPAPVVEVRSRDLASGRGGQRHFEPAGTRRSRGPDRRRRG